MRSIRVIIFAFLTPLVVSFGQVAYGADQQTGLAEKAAGKEEITQRNSSSRKLRFVDEDGDGLNDLIIDSNGDGIPDGRMRDGAGIRNNGSGNGTMYRQGGAGTVNDAGATRGAGASAGGGGLRHQNNRK
ncbi:MAG: hypothetical protein WCI64_08335 [Chlorobium sp.]